VNDQITPTKSTGYVKEGDVQREMEKKTRKTSKETSIIDARHRNRLKKERSVCLDGAATRTDI
jgi:predicted HAD superfamily Cof-like phosphohydrolase